MRQLLGKWRETLDDKGFEKRLARFDVFGIDAGVADQRIRHGDDLTGVGRVGQDFLIARHRGIENDFANGFALKAVSLAAKNTPVFEQQRGAPVFLHYSKATHLVHRPVSENSFAVDVLSGTSPHMRLSLD